MCLLTGYSIIILTQARNHPRYILHRSETLSTISLLVAILDAELMASVLLLDGTQLRYVDAMMSDLSPENRLIDLYRDLGLQTSRSWRSCGLNFLRNFIMIYLEEPRSIIGIPALALVGNTYFFWEPQHLTFYKLFLLWESPLDRFFPPSTCSPLNQSTPQPLLHWSIEYKDHINDAPWGAPAKVQIKLTFLTGVTL